MKYMSKLVFLMLLLLLLCSWIGVICRIENEKYTYKYHKEQLKNLEKKGIYVDALQNVEFLLKMNPENMELHLKFAEINKKLGNERAFIDKCEELIQRFQTKEEPYLCLANHYVQKGKYTEAIRILKKAKNVDKKERIISLYKELRGKFVDRYELFDEIKDWHGSITFVRENNRWAKVFSNGTSSNRFIYQDTGGFDLKESIFPAKVNNKWLYFDQNENRKLVSDKEYDFLGTFSENVAPIKRNGKAGFIKRNFKEYAMIFRITTPFKNGVAAVMDKKGKWGFVNKDFKYVTKQKYEDIVRDQNGFSSEFGVSFVKNNGVYSLVNLQGKRQGNLEFEDVKVFETNQYAAVKIKNKWGYINRKGELMIEPTFQNANSFSIGLSGFQKDELWGFIDMQGNVVIEPQFTEVRPFSKSGIAPVREGENWHFIQLYEYVK